MNGIHDDADGVGALGSLALIGAMFLFLVLGIAAVTCAARRRWRQSLRAALAAGLLVAVYAVSLVGVSVTAPAGSLATGEWKCFDDWCASVTSAVRTGDTVRVVLAVQNQGRREQAPDTPRAWLLHHGRRDEVAVPGLASRLPGGSSRQLPPIRLTAPEAELPRFLVTEGGFPSALVMGDDNSPCHPQPSWLLE